LLGQRIITNKSFSDGPHSGPNIHPNHQAVASLLSLPLPGVLTSAHINKVDDHRKGGNHKQSYKQAKGVSY